MPAYCSASGRVLLGALPPARLEAWLAGQARAPLAPLTPYTITILARLRHEIEQAREQGHAAVDQEFELGMRTLAVPLLDFRGEVRAALDVSANAARVSAAQLASRRCARSRPSCAQPFDATRTSCMSRWAVPKANTAVRSTEVA